ncbi:MAG TPA: NAD(P)-dependent alcohol dehydrogenase [Gemmatimonadaceae bacterium]|nr:NAD(P)-dependent alcohol dehydrogenase [Gemmatimonadaceae bacterium]
MTLMKAMVVDRYGKPSDMWMADLPVPDPGAGEVLVRVHVTAVNDWDWGFVTGRPLEYRPLFGLLRPKVSVLGVDIAGEVHAVGSSVQSLKPGERVLGDLSGDRFGGFAEFVLAKEKSLRRMPDEMDYDLAATLPHASMLAWQALVDVARIRAKERVLINGAGGGVGAFGAQIAKSFGCEVTGVDAAEKFQSMRSVGFDHVIDYRESDFSRRDERYDLILDARATRSPFAIRRALRDEGRYVAVGGHTTRILQILLAAPLIARLHGVHLHMLALKPNHGLENILALWSTRGLTCPVEGPYAFDDLPQALSLFGSARHAGKVLIRVALRT